jgi:hypothetical protein
VSKFLRMHPFLCVGVASFLLLYVPTAIGFLYDEGGWKGGLVLLGYGAGFVFRWVYALLFAVSGGRAFPGIDLASIAVGFGMYIAADVVLNRWRKGTKPAP